MSFVKKLKDILFEEEDEFTEPIKVKENIKEETKIVKIEPPKMEDKGDLTFDSKVEQKTEPRFESRRSELPSFDDDFDLEKFDSPKEPTRSEKSFSFPDFDEEEFVSSMSRQQKPNNNVLEYERKKTIEKRTDYGRYEKIETKEIIDKKKFKPSPIISPVYGILNQDYKAEDIVDKKDVAANITIEEVRKKAFEPKKEEKNVIDEPVVTFFEEKDLKEEPEEKKDDYKSIDDLLENASEEISLEDTLEVPQTNNMEAIEDELEKLDNEEVIKEEKDNLDDTLDSDLFELIDSMYDEREGE